VAGGASTVAEGALAGGGSAQASEVTVHEERDRDRKREIERACFEVIR